MHSKTTWGLALIGCWALACAFPVQAQELEWATSAGGTDSDFPYDIATDSAGNSYVTGLFYDSATFGAGEIIETTRTSAGDLDIFIAK